MRRNSFPMLAAARDPRPLKGRSWSARPPDQSDLAWRITRRRFIVSPCCNECRCPASRSGAPPGPDPPGYPRLRLRSRRGGWRRGVDGGEGVVTARNPRTEMLVEPHLRKGEHI